MKFRILNLLVFLLICASLSNGNDFKTKPDNLFFRDISKENVLKTKGYYNWGSSILKGNDGKYHLFYSRWKKEYKFTGWLLFSEIAHAVAENPDGPWQYKETLLKGRRNGHWEAITAHNPKVKYFNGKYYLYYISTKMGAKKYTENELAETARTGYSHPNWKILRENQRTGVTVANTLNDPWRRLEKPLIEPSGPITTLTVNPAVIREKDDRFYLIVKGDKPNEKRFIRNQAIAVSASPIGPFEMQPKPVIDYLDTEDMSLWYNAKRNYYYGVLISYDLLLDARYVRCPAARLQRTA